MISLCSAGIGEKELLYNLLQKYLYEMTEYYDDDVDANGNYAYRYFEDYFTDPSRKAFLILQNGAVAGFALLNRHSHIGGTPDYAVAEFCILPKYRKMHVAVQAFEMLLKTYPGSWEIKYFPKNTAAVRLWNRMAEPYFPEVHRLPDGEVVLSFRTN